MFRSILSALALVTVAATAQAQRPTHIAPAPETDRWLRVASSDDGTSVWYIDMQTATLKGEMLSAWVKVEFTKPQTTSLGRDYTVRLTQTLFDCSDRTSRDGQWLTQTASGAVARTGDFTGLAPWESAPPGTVWEGVMAAVCGRRK